jgi:hypothetical protein
MGDRRILLEPALDFRQLGPVGPFAAAARRQPTWNMRTVR